jgi:SAM-dependent methyltransferase
MHGSLIDLLVCPACRADAPLRLDACEKEDDGQILEGELGCSRCASRFPVRRGTPRFVATTDDYCGNFGFQWKRWKGIQIDRIQGHRLSETRFFDEVPWDREWMKGKWILDAGCGAGRFTDVAAGHGANVVACDISNAVDACRENTRANRDRVHTVQASLYDLPFRGGSFDAAFCFGVIQHTPDPRRTMETVPRFVRTGGWLAYDFYERTRWERPWVPHFFLRRYTPEWPVGRLLVFSHVLTAVFFPLAWVVHRTPVLDQLSALLPVAVFSSKELSLRAQYQWTVLDTFDWYGPRFEQRQNFREVATLLSRLGLQDIMGRPGSVTARLPDRWPDRRAGATVDASDPEPAAGLDRG